MQPEDRETMFWALSEIADRGPRATAVAPDSLLLAYRDGGLDEEEARRVERRLARNPANRRRLEELAGLAPSASPDRVRRRVLATTPDTRSPRRRWPVWQAWAAAAVVAVVLGAGWLTWRRPAMPLPAYEVQIAALTERRGLEVRDFEVPSLTAEAHADSAVTIDATVVERAVSGVEVGLYRVADEQVERLTVIGRLEVEERQGAVRFSASAADLVGTEPGFYDILVVIAWRGRLPATIDLEPGADPVAALAAAGWQVHRLTLRLLADSSVSLFETEPYHSRQTSDEEVAHALSHPMGSFAHQRSVDPVDLRREPHLGAV